MARGSSNGNKAAGATGVHASRRRTSGSAGARRALHPRKSMRANLRRGLRYQYGTPATQPESPAPSIRQRIRDANGDVALVRQPESERAARLITSLLVRNFGKEVEEYVKTHVAAAVSAAEGEQEWRKGGVQVWLYKRQADGFPLATLVWRWLDATPPGAAAGTTGNSPGWGEVLFNATHEGSRRAGYGTELVQAWIAYMQSQGATGVAVGCVGYGPASAGLGAEVHYGKLYWTGRGLQPYGPNATAGKPDGEKPKVLAVWVESGGDMGQEVAMVAGGGGGSLAATQGPFIGPDPSCPWPWFPFLYARMLTFEDTAIHARVF